MCQVTCKTQPGIQDLEWTGLYLYPCFLLLSNMSPLLLKSCYSLFTIACYFHATIDNWSLQWKSCFLPLYSPGSSYGPNITISASVINFLLWMAIETHFQLYKQFRNILLDIVHKYFRAPRTGSIPHHCTHLTRPYPILTIFPNSFIPYWFLLFLFIFLLIITYPL